MLLPEGPPRECWTTTQSAVKVITRFSDPVFPIARFCNLLRTKVPLSSDSSWWVSSSTATRCDSIAKNSVLKRVGLQGQLTEAASDFVPHAYLIFL